MISPDILTETLKREFPDAEVEIVDRTGQSDHFSIRVVSGRFAEMNLMDRHRSVMAVLQPLMSDGRLHAVELKTDVPT